MKRMLLTLCLLGSLFTFSGIQLGLAQDGVQERNVTMNDVLLPAKSLPLWTYNVTASRSGKPLAEKFKGMMVGTDPINAAPAVTKVPTYLISVQLLFQDSNHLFDPTEANACLTDNNQNQINVRDAAYNSPIFQNFGYPKLNNDDVMMGIVGGKTQYGDFYQRANFWAKLKGTKYQVLLSPVDKSNTVATDNVPVGTGRSGQYDALKACSWVGQVDLSWFDIQVRTKLLPAVKAVDPTAFPIFLLDSVLVCPSPFTVCITGYHSSFKDSNGDMQTYAVADFDRSGILTDTVNNPPQRYADVFTLSHEVAEWMDDPIVSEFGNNQIPGNETQKWGSDTVNVGQVPPGYCQDILEVGDPLSTPGNPPPPNLKPYTVTINNFTYHLQEMAYFSWFYGGFASIGTNAAGTIGKAQLFSNNGTLTSDAGAIPECKNGVWHGQ